MFVTAIISIIIIYVIIIIIKIIMNCVDLVVIPSVNSNDNKSTRMYIQWSSVRSFLKKELTIMV